ncbi:MAG: hypothetical protein C4340_04485, partial [Armatimonadota bacterium]
EGSLPRAEAAVLDADIFIPLPFEFLDLAVKRARFVGGDAIAEFPQATDAFFQVRKGLLPLTP